MLKKELEAILSKPVSKTIASIKIKKIYISCAKMFVSDLILFMSLTAPDTEIFYQDHNSPEWSYLLDCFSFHQFPDTAKLVNSYKNFFSFIAIGNSMISQQEKNDHMVKKLLKTSIYGTYYLFNKKRRLERNDLMNANPDLDLAIQLWNSLENQWLQQAMEVILPTIKINKLIYIPMTDTILTRDNVHQLPSLNEKLLSRL